ncbi:Integrase, catalytic core [Corchorus capsularis]|uniref:Integrase, catalytic core n=1 Tax=Corchorus capsularis TaxID=210143 RepID=A0A1R3G820_COCAP|nr:Integrase, catalytic core [Corchorus capsularis]
MASIGASTSRPKDFPSSPYYIHASGNPTLLLVSAVLIGPNYHSWSRAMKMALLTKNKLHFVDGSLPVPAREDSLYPACKCAITWLSLGWFTQYLPRLLSRLSAKKVREFHENDQVIVFIKGLSDLYASVKTQILLMDPLPSLNKAYSLVIQQERSSMIYVPNVADINVMAVKNAGSMVVKGGPVPATRKNFNNAKKAMCSYCGREGHTIDKCYKKHGYPANYSTNSRNQKRFHPQGYANAVALEDSESSDVVLASETCHEQNPAFQFTKEQYDQLMQMIQGITGTSHHVNAVTLPSSSNLPSYSGSIPSNCEIDAHISLSVFTNNTSHFHEWVLDTGATDHITYSLDVFHSVTPVHNVFVNLPNKTKVEVTHVGTVKLSNSLILTNVLYVPKFTFNLISVGKLAFDLHCCIIVLSSCCLIQGIRPWRMIGAAKLNQGLYKLNSKDILPAAFTSNHLLSSSVVNTVSCNKEESILWHKRLGHPSNARLKSLVPTVSSINDCEVCHMSKMKRLPFPSSDSVSLSAFDLIHVDIWGDNYAPTFRGHRYFLTIVDDFTRHTWVFLMKHKSEARCLMQNFIAYVATQFNTTVKCVRSDNGQEFNVPEFFNSKGIIHQTTCVKTPQQNSVVKRKHQHILNVARALRFQSQLPIQFWGECVIHSVHLINRMPTLVLHNISHYEALHSFAPVLDSIKVFGCLAFASNHVHIKNKFDSRSIKVVFLGFSSGVKGYKLYDIQTHKIFNSRDVIFYESILPFSLLNNKEQSGVSGSAAITETVFIHSDVPVQQSVHPVLQQSQHSSTTQVAAPTQPNTRTSPHLLENVFNYSQLSTSHRAFSVAFDQQVEPKSYKEAVKDSNCPVAKMTTVRVLLSLAAVKGWYLQQLDINNAFLHGDLEEEVYMKLPEGFSADPTKVSADHSLFLKETDTSFMALLVYVDDCIIAGDNFEEVLAIKKFLHDEFTIKDLGEVKYFLGLEVARSEKGINLCQKKYTLDLLKEVNFLDSKPVPTPILPETSLSKEKGTPLEDATQYRKIIGKLQYLTTTRPDISFTVQQLAQFLDKPTTEHLSAVHRVLRYLKGTIGFAFVRYRFEEEFTRAVLKGNDRILFGRRLVVRKATTRKADRNPTTQSFRERGRSAVRSTFVLKGVGRKISKNDHRVWKSPSTQQIEKGNAVKDHGKLSLPPSVNVNSGKDVEIEEFADAVVPGEVFSEELELEVLIPNDHCNWLERCVVVSVNSVANVEKVITVLTNCELKLEITEISNIMLLVCVEEEGLIDECIKLVMDSCHDFVSEIFPWESTGFKRKSIVWIQLEDVPLELWHCNFFSAFGEKWGKFLQIDDSTSSKKSLKTARLQILTSSTSDIPNLAVGYSSGIKFRIGISVEYESSSEPERRGVRPESSARKSDSGSRSENLALDFSNSFNALIKEGNVSSRELIKETDMDDGILNSNREELVNGDNGFYGFGARVSQIDLDDGILNSNRKVLPIRDLSTNDGMDARISGNNLVDGNLTLNRQDLVNGDNSIYDGYDACEDEIVADTVNAYYESPLCSSPLESGWKSKEGLGCRLNRAKCKVCAKKRRKKVRREVTKIILGDKAVVDLDSDISLSDGDIKRRNEILLKEAEPTFELSQALGIIFHEDRSHIISRLVALDGD